MHVLIVDDEPLARTALAQILEARSDVEGFDSPNDVVEAQELLTRHTYDVMLLDISMPNFRALTCWTACSRSTGRHLLSSLLPHILSTH